MISLVMANGICSCFGYQAAIKDAADNVRHRFRDSSTVMNLLYAAADPLLNSMSCARWLGSMDKKQLKWYSGSA